LLESSSDVSLAESLSDSDELDESTFDGLALLGFLRLTTADDLTGAFFVVVVAVDVVDDEVCLESIDARDSWLLRA
jgi:hypothetical protein